MHSNRNRKINALAVLSTAVGFAASMQPASAQTWNNPTTGNWNVGANWVGNAAPASNAATNLVFNATGAQSYVATNNIANPFLLNTMTFNSTSTGSITVAGSALSFTTLTGAINQNGTGTVLVSNPLTFPGTSNHDGLTFGGTGAGTVVLSGALLSNPAAGGGAGAALISTNPNGRLVLTGGGTLYGLRADRGNMFASGGVWSLASTERGNDVTGAPDGGFWDIVAGNSGAGPGSITFSNGAKIATQSAFAGNDPGQSGSLTFTDPGTVGTFTTAGFGRVGTNWGTGTFSVLNGASIFSTRTDIVRNAGGVGTLVVSGANSTINSADCDIGLEENAVATGIVSNGGKIILTDGANASALSVGWATGPLGDALTSTGKLTISGIGSSVSVVTGAAGFSGQFVAANGDVGIPATATLGIDSGGHLDAENSFLGELEGHVTMTIDGAGSNFVNRGQLLMESSTPSSMTLTNGGQLISQGTNFTATNPGDNVALTVSSNSVVDLGADVADSVAVFSGGGAGDGGTTTVTINTGGELKGNLVNAAQNANSLTNITVDGTNSKLTISGPDAQLVLAGDNGSVANLTVSNGGKTTIGTNGAAFVSTGTTSIATVTVTGTNSQFDASAAGAQLQIGGSGTIALGAATFSVLNNASATVGDLTVVFTPGVLNIGSGTTKASFISGTNGTVVNGTVNFNAGTFNSTGTLAVGGSVLLSSAGRNAAGVPSNKKMVEAGSATLTTSGVIDLNDNDALFHDSSRSTYEAFVKNARHGGAWDLPGITSTAAKNSVPKNKGLGVISGTEFHTGNGASATFNGKTVANTDTLIKFTFNGDTDLNGKVNFDDYARIDSGFNNHRSGWFNGDFDYSGTVDFDDYSLIDQAFNTQGTVVLSAAGGLAGPGQRDIVAAEVDAIGRVGARDVTEFKNPRTGSLGGGNLQAVPEPATCGLIGVAMVGALRRRRRSAR